MARSLPSWARRRAAERAAAREASAMARAGEVIGLVAFEPDPLVDLVGWAIFDADTGLHGRAHVCRLCAPTLPSGQHQAIYRIRLAARQACERCGRVLEFVNQQEAHCHD